MVPLKKDAILFTLLPYYLD